MINSDLYQCMWTGSNAQECYDSCESGNLYTAYDGYVSNIDAAEDAHQLGNKYTKRKNE